MKGHFDFYHPRTLSSRVQRSDFTAFGQRGDAISRAKCQRLDGHRRLPAAGGHKAAAVAQEKVRNRGMGYGLERGGSNGLA